MSTTEERIAGLEAQLTPDEVTAAKESVAGQVRAEEQARPPSAEQAAEIARLEAQLTTDELAAVKEGLEQTKLISIPTDADGNAVGEPGFFSDVQHGVLNVANASVRDAGDFAMSLFDLPLWVAQKAGEKLTNTPQKQIDDFDKNVDFTDRMDEIMTMVGVTEEQPARSNLEQGALNVVPALATSVSALGAVRPSIKAVEKDFARYLRPDAKGILAGGAVESAGQVYMGGGESKEAELAGAATALVVGGFSELAESALDLIRSGVRVSHGTASDFNTRQKDIAGGGLQQALADDAPIAIEKVEDLGAQPGFEQLTPGQLTENRRVQQLEREVIMNDPVARQDFEASQLSLQDYLRTRIREALGSEVGGEAFIANYLKGAERAADRLEMVKQQAVINWARFVRESPDINSDYGTPLKKIFLDNQAEGRRVEKEFWAAAQLDDVPVKSPAMDALFREMESVMAEAGEADVAKGLIRFPDDGLVTMVRAWAKRAQPKEGPGIGPFGPQPPRVGPEDATVTADALINARANFLDDAAEAAANRNPSLARRNYKMADAILEAITSADPNQPNAYDAAREFSRLFNDSYSRDIIGPLLSRSPNRDARVPANQVLERFIAPKEQGRTNIIAMRGANGGEVPEVAKQGILTALMRAGDVDILKGPDLTNVAGMESWAAAHMKMLIEADMVDDVKRFITFARQQQLGMQAAADAATALGKTAAANQLRQYGGTPEKLATYVTSLLTANAKNPGDSIKDLFFTFDLLSGKDLPAAEIAVARQGLRSIVTDGVFNALFHSTVDASKVNPRIATRQLGQRIIAALESTGQWSAGDIERLTEAMEILRLQHAGNPLRVKDAAGGSRLPGEISASLQTTLLEKIGKLAVLRYIAPRFTQGTGGAKLAIAGEAGKGGKQLGKTISEFFGAKLDATGAGDLFIMALFNHDLWLALAKREVDLTPADVGLLRSAATKIAKTATKAAVKIGTGLARRPGITSKAREVGDADPREEQNNG